MLTKGLRTRFKGAFAHPAFLNEDHIRNVKSEYFALQQSR